jgi:hypothetical protein
MPRWRLFVFKRYSTLGYRPEIDQLKVSSQFCPPVSAPPAYTHCWIIEQFSYKVVTMRREIRALSGNRMSGLKSQSLWLLGPASVLYMRCIYRKSEVLTTSHELELQDLRKSSSSASPCGQLAPEVTLFNRYANSFRLRCITGQVSSYLVTQRGLSILWMNQLRRKLCKIACNDPPLSLFLCICSQTVASFHRLLWASISLFDSFTTTRKKYLDKMNEVSWQLRILYCDLYRSCTRDSWVTKCLATDGRPGFISL